MCWSVGFVDVGVHSRVVAANADYLAAIGSDGGHIFADMVGK